jgi:hypothetical protein
VGAWSLWVREDLLSACGYSFTPVKEIAANLPSRAHAHDADFAITPAIETPADFEALLQKIADLN